MKLLLIFFTLLIFSCSSDKDKKVNLEIFKKQGEKINVFEANNVFDKEYSIVIKPVSEFYISNGTDFHGGYAKVCSSSDFANALVKYYDDKELMEKHGERARQHILNKYSWNGILKSFSRIYKN